MASLDSMGSRSLDAFAPSRESTDPFAATPEQRIESNKVNRENCIYSHEHELTSACTLCNISDNRIQAATSKLSATPDSVEYVRQAVKLFEEQDQQLPKDIEFSSLPVVKKPSYLGISCSLSGYSSLTSYDSKVREGFRTRDKSPAPPPPRLLSNMPNKEVHNGVESNFKMSLKTPGSSPLERQMDSRPTGTGISSKKSHFVYESLNASPGAQCSGRNFRENTQYYSSGQDLDQMDETDFCIMSRRCGVIQNASSEQTKVANNNSSSAFSASSPLRRSPGAVRVTEFTCQTKSFIHTQVTSTETQQVTSSIDNYGGVRSNGVHNDEKKLDDTTSTVEECKTPKSFVQQRIERLYGPGALAQGFLSRVRKISSSFEESPKQVSPSPGIASGSPYLPVLRHLRPEFRAQLPLTCTPSTKHQHQVHNSGPSVPNSSPDLESSITSLADFQPAAPDVPVIKAETPLLPSERSNVDSQLTSVSRTASCRSDVCSSLSDCSAVETVNTLSESVNEDVEQEKNGHHFLKVLHKEIERLSRLADQTEHELYNIEDLSEDIQGKLRAASGQARLLMKQKLQQFEGLCNKNISQCPGEAFPTTAQDLEGFWDMVKLQIDHVDQLFSEIDILRKNNWKDNLEHATNSGTINGSRRRQSTRHSATKPASAPASVTRAKVVTSTPFDKKKNDSTRRSREEQALARKKLMEERRQALKAQQAKTEQHVEIYVASRNGK